MFPFPPTRTHLPTARLGAWRLCRARKFRTCLISTGLQPGELHHYEPLAVSTASADCEKPLKRLLSTSAVSTGLKPGANERCAREYERCRLGPRRILSALLSRANFD